MGMPAGSGFGSLYVTLPALLLSGIALHCSRGYGGARLQGQGVLEQAQRPKLSPSGAAEGRVVGAELYGGCPLAGALGAC